MASRLQSQGKAECNDVSQPCAMKANESEGRPKGTGANGAASEEPAGAFHMQGNVSPQAPSARSLEATLDSSHQNAASDPTPCSEGTVGGNHGREGAGHSASPSPSSSPVASPNKPTATSTLMPSAATTPQNVPLKTRRAAILDLWYNGWLKEILSWVIAVLTFTATIVVLIVFDGKRLPELGHGLTLNGLISILTTIMKLSLAICLAGALGQLKWNWFTASHHPLDEMRTFDKASGEAGILRLMPKFKIGYLHTLGASLLSLQLGFDTSFQQTVHYPSVSLASTTQNATIANSISAGVANNLTPGFIDTDLLAAIYEGVFGNPAATGALSLPMYCPSGNCSWTNVVSLGLCYRCANVTTDLSHYGNYSALCIDDPPVYDSTKCGPSVELSNRPLARDVPSYQLYTIAQQDHSTAFRDLPFFLASFAVLQIPAKYLPLENYFPISDYWEVWATECAFEYCYQTFDITYRAGSIHRYLQNVSQEADFLHNLTRFPPIGSGDITAALTATLNGTIYGDQYPSNVVVARFFSLSDLYSMASNISAALGIWFSTSTAFAGDPAIGTVWLQETQVRVLWPWITLPTFLLAASGIFLLMVVFDTRRQTKKSSFLGIWKNNALAPFFHGLDKATRESLGPGRNATEMKAAAKKVLVKLDGDGDGFSSLGGGKSE